ncbi:MAG: DUF5615 family PIN-like protein [Deltaproteobacteria bacterium]|nr:DUF5615 family PIN-like protein [Deltaproteobacteria bacterium]
MIDNNPPREIADVFSTHGHSVLFSRDQLGPEASDAEIAAYALNASGLVVTWDKDFMKLRRKNPSLGLVRFQCKEEEAVIRLTAALPFIEFALGRRRNIRISVRRSTVDIEC